MGRNEEKTRHFHFFTLGASVFFGNFYRKHVVLLQLRGWGQCGGRSYVTWHQQNTGNGESEIQARGTLEVGSLIKRA